MTAFARTAVRVDPLVALARSLPRLAAAALAALLWALFASQRDWTPLWLRLAATASACEATLIGILAERRNVLAWGRDVRQSDARRRDRLHAAVRARLRVVVHSADLTLYRVLPRADAFSRQ